MADGNKSEITDKKKHYTAGVLKYAQMRYLDGGYEPKPTGLLALFRIHAAGRGGCHRGGDSGGAGKQNRDLARGVD